MLTRGPDSGFLHVCDARFADYAGARQRVCRGGARVRRPKMLEWVRTGEAALSGTAAVLAGVGTLIHPRREVPRGQWRSGHAHRAFAHSWSRSSREGPPDRHGGSAVDR